jgi:hypothetical protein
MLNFSKLLSNLKHNISTVETFKKYSSKDWINFTNISLLPKSTILWNSYQSKITICSWPPIYASSGYTHNHVHYVKLLHGNGSLFIVNNGQLESTKLLPFITHKIPLGKEWIISQNSELMISMHLYDKTVIPALN